MRPNCFKSLLMHWLYIFSINILFAFCYIKGSACDLRHIYICAVHPMYRQQSYKLLNLMLLPVPPCRFLYLLRKEKYFTMQSVLMYNT